MDSPLTDSEDIVRKFLQEKYVVRDESFIVTKFDVRGGEHYLVKVEKNYKIEFPEFDDVAIFKHSYLSIDGSDYTKWKKIYLRKYKLLKIKNNVKIH